MHGVAGLRGQVSALPLIAAGQGVSRGPLPVLGVPSSRGLVLTATPSNISGSGPNGTLNSGVVAITQKVTRRAEALRQQWRQISGLPGVVLPYSGGGVYFQHSGLPSDATSSFVWRCTVDNNFGFGGQIDVAFTLTTYTPVPDLVASASPSSPTSLPINPTTRQATAYYSASVSSGVPPYSFDWNGGDFENSASNQSTFTLPVGAPSGINFIAGCWVTDGLGRSVLVQTANFFIYEGP